MDCSSAVERLRARERELRALGLSGLSLFGSTARGVAGPAADIDLAATFEPAARVGMFRFAMIEAALRDMLGVSVDLVGEPARAPNMQAQIDRDRVRVF